MENNPLRGLFGVSSPRPEPQLATPQPTAPTENIEYEIPSGMIEQLLANPYAGDGTEHPDMHLIYVEQICGLFMLAGLPRDEIMKRFSLYLLREKSLMLLWQTHHTVFPGKDMRKKYVMTRRGSLPFSHLSAMVNFCSFSTMHGCFMKIAVL